VFEVDTPVVDITKIDGDTGFADRLGKFAGQTATDGTLDTGTGLNNVTATTDTGAIVNAVWNASRAAHTVAGSFGASDTGVNARFAAIAAKTGSLTFSVAGNVDANVTYVNDTAVQGTGDTGTDPWRPA
jgi:hypothetical protein